MAMERSFKAVGGGDQFIAFLKGFIKENPNSIIAYNMLGQAYAVQKNWDDANNILQKALKLEPGSIGTYRLLAAVLVQQGKATEVVELYRKGLAVSPDNPQLMMELARYFERTGNSSEAIATYDSLLKKFPGSDEVANNLADLLVNSSTDSARLEQALLLVERFKDSKNPYFLDTYGWVLFKSGDVEKALAVFNKAVSVVPDNAVLRYHLGEAYHATGDHDASKVELEKSLSLVKKNNEFSGIKRAKQLLKEIGGSAHS